MPYIKTNQSLLLVEQSTHKRQAPHYINGIKLWETIDIVPPRTF